MAVSGGIKWCGWCVQLKKKLPRLTRRMIKIYCACFLAMLSTAFSITMLFPFLPFMVEFLLPQLIDNEESLGYYVGIIASAMFLGRVFGSYIWGIIADHKGRKPVIIVTLVLLGMFSASFGLSVHFAMAVVLRFFVGLTNGIVGTIKAVISEVSDDTNQAFGISLVSSAMGFGFIIGPAVSGAIADPIGQYNLTIHNEAVNYFLSTFPYSLPCIVNFLLCIMAAIAVFFLLPETLGVNKNRRRSEMIQSSDLKMVAKNASSANDEESSDTSSLNSNDETRLLDHDNTDCGNVISTDNLFITNLASVETKDNVKTNSGECHTDDDIISSSKEQLESSVAIDDQAELLFESEATSDTMENSSSVCQSNDSLAETDAGEVKVKRSLKQRMATVVMAKLKDLGLFLCSRKSGLAILNYCVFSFGVIGFDEIYSLWCKTSPHLGGLGLTLHEIGISLTISAVMFLPFSFFAFAYLEKKVGSIHAFYLSVTINIVAVIMMPNLHYTATSELRWVMWVLLCFLRFILGLFITVSFGASMVFINNSVTFDKLGAINGLAVSLTALTRCISPVLSGSIFSLSLSKATTYFGFPVNYHLVFVIFSSVFLSTVFMVACLPKSINKQMIIEDVDEAPVKQ